MYSFCRLALLLALGLPAIQTVQAQSSSSNPPAPVPDQAQQSAASQTSGQLSVQARIRARREQRRAAAIREAYSHRYEAYLGGGYLRFRLPSPLQRVNELNWDAGFTRYFDERLGVTVDGRGIYGKAFVYPKAGNSNITNPSIVQYAALIGPSYRFYIQPKYSIAGRVMGGFAYGNFSGDTGGNTAISNGILGLYPDGSTYAASASIVGEYNVTPNVAMRVAPEYFLTGFGSSMQNDLGFTAGIVYRFGKQ
jgi:hypothetical protein